MVREVAVREDEDVFRQSRRLRPESLSSVVLAGQNEGGKYKEKMKKQSEAEEEHEDDQKHGGDQLSHQS